jgi:deoxyribodipyrimidine photolyase-related protein
VSAPRPRTLLLVLGDQLDRKADALEALDPERDAVWMAEVAEEIERVPSHKRRIALFLSAMRHFRDELRARGFTVHYHELTADGRRDSGRAFADVLGASLKRLSPERVTVTRPGDHRVLTSLGEAVRAWGGSLEVVEDAHFLITPDAFSDWLSGRKRVRLEDFQRHMRKERGVLLDDDGGPAGGEWNYDSENRESFGRDGPGTLPPVPRFEPDEVTRAVLELVEGRWPDHPGTLEDFAEAVTPEHARTALGHFIDERLAHFGTYQDALWSGEQELYHSRLSAAMNLKLLDPREAIAAAEEAWCEGAAPINAVEGFIRQILGWREFIRGIYWHHMPEYADLNALECDDVEVPSFFWDGDTDMACVADAMRGLLRLGYAHHIQRLMVLGLFAQLAGVHPHRFHEWHMALYLDAVDWVSLPNTLGMSQYGDGGIVGSKPYCATGNYIKRQGNHCAGCRYDPKQATGGEACPFTTLYWDFLDRHRERLDDNRRMTLQLRNVDRKDGDELAAIRARAGEVKERLRGGGRV